MEESRNLQEESIGTSAISFKTLTKAQLFDKMHKIAGKCVCKITTNSIQGTCTFYKVSQCETTRILIMTFNHVMPTTSLN